MATGSATNGHELQHLVSVQGSTATFSSAAADDYHQTFTDRFPGVTNPRDGLTLLYRLDYKDGPYLTLCLRMLYPEVVAGRDELAKQLEALCAFVGCSRQVASEGKFWFTTFFLQCSEWRYGTGEWRSYLGHRTEDSSEGWRRRAEEAEIVLAAVRVASHVVSVQLAGVREPMILRNQMERQLGRLEGVMANLQRWLQDRTAVAARQEGTLIPQTCLVRARMLMYIRRSTEGNILW